MARLLTGPPIRTGQQTEKEVGSIPVFKLVFLFVFTVAAVIQGMKNLSTTTPTQGGKNVGSLLLEPRTLEEAYPATATTATATATGSSMTQSAAAATAVGVDPGKYPPFSCAKLLKDLKTDQTMQAKDPNEGRMHVKRTVENPPFYVSLHNQEFDKPRWDVMTYGFYYERLLTRCFQTVLRNSPPGSRVLDVGGTIRTLGFDMVYLGSFLVGAG